MISALKASMETVPSRTIRVVGGSVALGSATIALAVVAFFRPSLGIFFGYAWLPFLFGFATSVFIAVLRLRMVGFLPSEADDLIPDGLRPWIRSWLMIRFGLLGSGLLLILTAILTAIAHRSSALAIEALVYIIWLRIFLDLVFGAAFNAGVIASRV